MSSPDRGAGDQHDLTLQLAAMERIEQACVRFEEAWTRGEKPRIEEHQSEFQGNERWELTRRLFLIELGFRRRRGDRPRREEYADRFPELMQFFEGELASPSADQP